MEQQRSFGALQENLNGLIMRQEDIKKIPFCKKKALGYIDKLGNIGYRNITVSGLPKAGTVNM